ncbi:4Fe-4S dicluster domain-containing protein [Ruminococcus bromii]|nr:4Fe-4S dicluster domain-containing protein [Ruminococcus bromii]
MISINDKANCTGCGACYSICPKKAITLKEDFSGFSIRLLMLTNVLIVTFVRKYALK